MPAWNAINWIVKYVHDYETDKRALGEEKWFADYKSLGRVLRKN